VQVLRCSWQSKAWTRRLINCPELSQASKHHLHSFSLFPFGSKNLGFLLRENLAAIFIIPSSWGFQLDGEKLSTPQASRIFLAPLPGSKRRLLRGEFHTHILYFVLSFALLYFYLHRFIKNPKKLESLVVVISLL
jgi:hypothetical protein